MDQRNSDVKLGRFLSLVLRHDPGAAGITLDEHGWADVDGLLAGVRATGRSIDRETLERIVRENNKQRYSFNEDHTKIRANQGHSVQVDVELKAVEPPRLLYHGTATRFFPAIQAEGIRKMSRQHVHLSGDFETAMAVGKRHGAPMVITIDAAAMARDGVYFQCSRRCHDEIFYNKDTIYAMNAAIDENLCIPSDLIPRCPQCGAELEPWVRGYTFLEGEKYRDEYRKINEFLNRNKNDRILFLELGVGRMTPMFIQEPFWNLTYQLPKAYYITVNSKDALLPRELSHKGLAIKEDIASVLQRAVALKKQQGG